ncbi:MAG TPA: Hsp33 family molecular chaperone HslO [Steroidobacteraceae bacterium]|nr:Hsp33 family molecular chaperone HslO [Steroidobacteraceae bacterium]
MASDLAASTAAEPGTLRRFLLEAQPLRGHWVRLGSAWQELRAHRSYPPLVEALLGEAATAAVLLSATLKFSGTLTLQFSGNGRVRLLVAQCTDDFQLRAVAHHDLERGEVAEFAELVGTGRLAVTVQPDASTAQYQGIVPLEGADLAQCLERYFESSEQLPTRLMLAADATRTGGMLLQKLPSSGRGGEGAGALLQLAWEDLQAGLAALSPEVLLESAAEEAVRQVAGAHDVRLFGVTPVRFGCRCSDARVAGLVRSLGLEEARAALAEQGSLTVTCEFCGRDYRYDSVDVEHLFAADGPVPHSPGRYN